MMAVYEVLGRYGAPTYVLYQLPGFETIIREGTEEQIEAVLSTLGTGEQIWNPLAPSRAPVPTLPPCRPRTSVRTARST